MSRDTTALQCAEVDAHVASGASLLHEGLVFRVSPAPAAPAPPARAASSRRPPSPPPPPPLPTWRDAPHRLLLFAHHLFLLRPVHRSGAHAVAASFPLTSLRVRDALADCAESSSTAARAGLYNALELRGGSGSPVLIVPANSDDRAEWLAALSRALTDALPPDEQLERGALHRLALTGTLHAAAYAHDAVLLAACLRFTERGLSDAPLTPSAVDVPLLDVNALDDEGVSPLLAAAHSGAPTDILTALLEGGADAHATDVDGNTPLHCALSRGHVDAAQLLLVNAAPLDARNLCDATPFGTLLVTLASGEVSTIKDGGICSGTSPALTLLGLGEALLSYGAPADDVDGEGCSLLHRVALLSDAPWELAEATPRLVRALVRKGGDVNARALLGASMTTHGGTSPSTPEAGSGGGGDDEPSFLPLHLACGAVFDADARPPPLFDLSETAAASRHSGAIGSVPSVRAISPALVAALLRYGAHPNARTGGEMGEAPLHLILRRLLALRCAAAEDGVGDAAAREAAAAQFVEAACVVAGAGGRLDVLDRRGVSVRSLADAAGLTASLEAARSAHVSSTAPSGTELAPLPPGAAALLVRPSAPATSGLVSLFGSAVRKRSGTAGSGSPNAACALCGGACSGKDGPVTCRRCGVSACASCTSKRLLPTMAPATRPVATAATSGVDSDDDEAPSRNAAAVGNAISAGFMSVFRPPPSGNGGGGGGSGGGGSTICCDGCFAASVHLSALSREEASAWAAEKAAALEHARNFADDKSEGLRGSRVTSLAAFTNRLPGVGKQGAAALPAGEDAQRAALFGGSSVGSNAGGARGSEAAARGAATGGASRGAFSSLSALLSGNKDKLVQRGEKISEIQDSSAKLSNDAGDFAALAQKLKARHSGWGLF